MNANSLQAVQPTLNERGARDVKFFFSPEMASMALSDAKDMLAGVLSSYLNSPKKPFSGIGDNKKQEA